MQVLVTGGAGFIGSHLVNELLAQGHRVSVLDDFSSGNRTNLDVRSIRLIEGDVRNADLVRKAAEGAEVVFHLAAMVSVPASVEDPVHCYEVNVLGSLNTLWAAHQAGCRRVVLASSAAVYGEVGRKVNEAEPPSPQSPYATSKLAMESAGALFVRSYGLQTVTLRLFNVYGPRQSPDSPYAAVVPRFIKAVLAGAEPIIFGSGEQQRDFIFVEDAVRAFLLSAERPHAAGGVYNIAGGGSVSILHMYQALQAIVPSAPQPVFAPARAGDIDYSEAAIQAAQTALGYRPMIGLDQGLSITVEWFRQREVH